VKVGELMGFGAGDDFPAEILTNFATMMAMGIGGGV
jgi:hypothetical protein